MRKIKFKGDNLSTFALGTVQLGIDYGISNKKGKPTLSEAKDILEFVTSTGINCFDTASGYGDSEKILGNFLSLDSFVVSKLSSKDFLEDVNKVLNNSLVNLKRDSLFAFLLHDSKLLSSWNLSYTKIVKNLKESGKIKYFGVSIYTSEEFEEAIQNDCVDLIQIPFNLFDHRAIREKWFEKAKEKNKLLIVRSIFLQGLLLMDEKQIPLNLQDSKQYIRKLEEICSNFNFNKKQLIINFILTIAKNSIILFGCETKEQAKENINFISNFKELDSKILKSIYKEFDNITESIYNPSKW